MASHVDMVLRSVVKGFEKVFIEIVFVADDFTGYEINDFTGNHGGVVGHALDIP